MKKDVNARAEAEDNRDLILITGSSRGIGRSAAVRFLEGGWSVAGIDVLPGSISHPRYTHYIADVADPGTLPELEILPSVIFSNAGVQNSPDDIAVNLRGAMNVTEKYAFHDGIKSVLFNASASARTGSEFPEYAASKAGLVGYMKNVAIRLAPYGATSNSISPGGVTTESNAPVTGDPVLWERIMAVTPLRKWASPEEIAEWVWFLTVVNRSASGTDVLVDNGESALNQHFVWPEDV